MYQANKHLQSRGNNPTTTLGLQDVSAVVVVPTEPPSGEDARKNGQLCGSRHLETKCLYSTKGQRLFVMLMKFNIVHVRNRLTLTTWLKVALDLRSGGERVGENLVKRVTTSTETERTSISAIHILNHKRLR